MKKFKTLFIALMVLVTAAIATFALVGCDKGNYLTVATNAEFPPFEYYEGDKIVGFDMEYIDAIAKQMGYDGAKIEHMDFDSVIPSVQSGQYDVAIAGLTVDDERKEKVDFSNTYFNASQTIIYKGETLNYTTEEELWNFLKGKKIGVAKGFSGNLMIDEALAEGGILAASGATTTKFKTGGLAVQELVNGKIDVVVIDNAPAQEFAKKFADKGVKASKVAMGDEKYAIAVKKGNNEMLNKINEAMKALEENGKFAEITAKYFG